MPRRPIACRHCIVMKSTCKKRQNILIFFSQYLVIAYTGLGFFIYRPTLPARNYMYMYMYM